MTDAFVRVPHLVEGDKIDNTLVRGDVYRQRVETYPGLPINLDASARTRVSQITTLFDGKTLSNEDAFLWRIVGTGTATFENGSTNKLSVGLGEYLIRQTKQYFPYFSGKSQLVEPTFDNFAPEAGLVKRAGYFSSNAVAPYDQNYDGWYLESNGDAMTIYLVVVNDGTEKLRIPLSQWDGYAALADYDWDNFTVTLVDFLWLGGAVLRLFVKDPAGGFPLAHTFDYAGTAPGVFMKSPNQPVRYEIRSTTGTGYLSSICSQVATEGALNNQSKSLALWHSTLITANTVGTIYAIKGVKKRADFRDIPVEIKQFGGSMTATADAGIWLLLLNPTLSAPLVYTQNTVVDEATGTNQTVTDPGRVLGVIHINQAGASLPFAGNQLSWLNISIDDTPDEYVLAYMPLTQNQSVNGALSIQVF